jgi:DNA-binding NarL/FixJ family response regulator
MTDGERPLRVIVGEDDVLLREGIARILTDAGLEVVARCGDADELLRRGLAHRPDVVIADVQMPPRGEDDGLQAALELRRREPGVGVLVLSQFCEPGYVLELVGQRPEGVGYLLKERVGDLKVFVDSITRVAAGGSALDPEVVGVMLGRRQHSGPLQLLTSRERAVLAAMAEGLSNLGIAQSLCTSQASVEKHVTAIFRKLHLAPADTDHRRVQAVLAYLRADDRHPTGMRTDARRPR